MLDAFVAEARIRWGLDPAAGLQIATADRLAETPIEPSRPLLLVPLTALHVPEPTSAGQSPLPGRHAPADSGALAILRRLYPADHVVGRIGVADATTVGELDTAALAGPLYLAPVAPERATASPWSLPWIAARLRQPDGCPWDREQTHQSLKKSLLEEAYEVYDILDGGATPELAGELGDLYLQIVLHAQLAAEAGVFDMTDVEEAISRKIVRRHPHVFGDARASTASDVNRQWEQIKRAEREEAAAPGAPGETTEVRSALDGISKSMPALAATQEMQERAANLGYDWPTIDGILDKVAEEAQELREATTNRHWAEEFGDLLFVLVNLARRQGVEAEAAMRDANAKFRRRFGSVERQAAAKGVALHDLDFAALDTLWDHAKAEERTS